MSNQRVKGSRFGQQGERQAAEGSIEAHIDPHRSLVIPFIYGTIYRSRPHSAEPLPCGDEEEAGMGPNQSVEIDRHTSSLSHAFPSPSEAFDTYYC